MPLNGGVDGVVGSVRGERGTLAVTRWRATFEPPPAFSVFGVGPLLSGERLGLAARAPAFFGVPAALPGLPVVGFWLELPSPRVCCLFFVGYSGGEL